MGEMKKRVVKGFVFFFFALLYILSLLGIYKYLEWLFSVPLLTTAGIVGIIVLIPIFIAELFYTLVTFWILREILNS
jgi:hypothetical protein